MRMALSREMRGERAKLMTLIIALRCSDGLVMAADGMATEANPAGLHLSKREAEKLVVQNKLLWASSGWVVLRQAVLDKLAREKIHWRNVTATELRRNLLGMFASVLKEEAELIQKVSNLRFTGEFVFGAHLADGFHLITMDYTGASQVVDSRHCSLGGAAKTGQVLLRRLRDRDWDVRTGLVVAYRTMSDAINVEPAASCIGPPISLARYTVKGPEIFDNESVEYRNVVAAAEAWGELENEALARKTFAAKRKRP